MREPVNDRVSTSAETPGSGPEVRVGEASAGENPLVGSMLSRDPVIEITLQPGEGRDNAVQFLTEISEEQALHHIAVALGQFGITLGNNCRVLNDSSRLAYAEIYEGKNSETGSEVIVKMIGGNSREELWAMTGYYNNLRKDIDCLLATHRAGIENFATPLAIVYLADGTPAAVAMEMIQFEDSQRLDRLLPTLDEAAKQEIGMRLKALYERAEREAGMAVWDYSIDDVVIDRHGVLRLLDAGSFDPRDQVGDGISKVIEGKINRDFQIAA